MRARIVSRDDVLKIVDLLRRDHEVVAPFYGRGRDTVFEVVTDENRDRIQLHLPNPYYPPKRFVFPPMQRLLRTTLGERPRIEETLPEPRKRAIFGIRSCDVAGLLMLDRQFLGGDFRDVYYDRLRQSLFLVNVVCTDPELDIDEDCFCLCADTGPAAREHFDLQIMDLGDELMVVAGSPAGEALFADPLFRKGTPDHVAHRRAVLTRVRASFKNHATSWYAGAMRLISNDEVSDDAWEELGRRCLECGGCSFVCPTCNCFTVTDRQVGETEVERVRLWDSCALSGFTRMAGGHNPRKAVHDRRNRRFFRKLAHYYVQRQLSVVCVGCGRCVNVCHGDVGMPSVVEILRRMSAEEASR